MRAADVLGLPSVAAMREALEAVGNMHPVDPDIECQTASLGGVRGEWLSAPSVSTGKVVLYFHGGGYVIGSPNTHRRLAGRVSRVSGARVFLADYRLAPEHPFPAAVDDAVAAYRAILSHGLRGTDVVLAGDSAGGGLAIATALTLRDSQMDTPAALACISPWTDLEVTGESMASRAAIDPVCHKTGIVRLARIYLAGQSARLPLASPLYADLRGLPPTLIHIGEAETLYDDSARFAARAKEAGVVVSFKEWADMIHVFPLFVPDVQDSRDAIQEIGDFIRRHLNNGRSAA
jgi:acetyl esterase/lipase